MVTLGWPEEMGESDVLEGGHIAISVDGSADERISYFAIMAADYARRTVSLYVKESAHGGVSAALLNGGGAASFRISKPTVGVVLPKDADRLMFVTAGSGMASGLGLIGRHLRGQFSECEASFLYVGNTHECDVVRASVAGLAKQGRIDLLVWDTGLRSKRVGVDDIIAAMNRVNPDWVYVCGPVSFAEKVHEAASAAFGQLPPIVTECYEDRAVNSA